MFVFCFILPAYAQSQAWLDLLYYEPKGDGYESIADGQDFFITKYGKTSPKAEYEAALKLSKEQDEDFRKIFPLRYKYLSQIHKLSYQPLVQLDKKNKIEHVMLAYPNRYVSSPTSMFGHIFLLLNTKEGRLDSQILHYLADPAGSNLLTFIPKGITGQFKGKFLKEDYYKRIKFYNQLEDRKIQYYDLKLTAEQIENLQLHLIELQQTHFDYYFFDENCAYFIGKLLNVILEEEIAPKYVFIYPAQIINRLNNTGYLSHTYERLPSNTLFNQQYNHLTSLQKKQVWMLIHQKQDEPVKDEAVLKSFLYISTYFINNKSHLTGLIQYNRLRAYQALHTMGIRQVRPILKKSTLIKPLTTQSLKLSHTSYKNQGSIHLAYHPLLFSEYETFQQVDANRVDILASEVRVNKRDNFFYQLRLFRVDNFQQYNRITQHLSWRIQSHVAFQDKVMSHHAFEMGPAISIAEQSLFYFFLGASLSNYNLIFHHKTDQYKLQPLVTLGTKTSLNSYNLRIASSLSYRLDDYYLQLKICHKWREHIMALGVQANDQQQQFSFSIQHLF
eukprot:COSAG01_NODE_9_length_43729_cov_66.133463_18_plen_559_part_00